MKHNPEFVILPYLTTSEPVQVRGIQFRSSGDLEGLPEESRRHLATLFQMFFLKDDLRITEMTYAHLELPDDEQKSREVFRRLRQAHSLVSYIYNWPIIGEMPHLHAEHVSLFWLWPDVVPESPPRWAQERVRNLTGQDISNESTAGESKKTQGYSGLLNFNWWLEVMPGGRLYPPVPKLYGPSMDQDLYRDLDWFSHHYALWAWEALIEGQDIQLPDLEARVFTALEWYNRSNEQEIGEDTALVYLAIAFESLLQLEQGEALSRRFKETVLTLLGAVPRLDSWLDQFYTARSKIVHQGTWPHMKFYAVDRQHLRDVQKGKKRGVEYMPLVSYGRWIFQICLNTTLSGALLARTARLRAHLVHPQERLEGICALLSRTDGTASERLLSVYEDVLGLFLDGATEDVEPRTLGTAAKLTISTYLETEPELPDEVRKLMAAMLTEGTSVTPDDSLERLRRLAMSIREWRGELPRFFVPYASDWSDVFRVVWLFVAFATWPELPTHLRPSTPVQEPSRDSQNVSQPEDLS